jgi:TM2 domain-containing membrane protein YozV
MIGFQGQRSSRTGAKREPSLLASYLLWLPPLGFLGLHRFYLDRPATGFIWLVTGGFFGIGWFLDAFSIPFMVFSKKSRRSFERSVEVQEF